MARHQKSCKFNQPIDPREEGIPFNNEGERLTRTRGQVLNTEGEEENSKTYFMDGFINGNRFKTMIVSGSPVRIFALDELKRIMKRESLQVRNMIKGEKYVDFNGKPLNLLGYVFCELQVRDRTGWLSTLR